MLPKLEDDLITREDPESSKGEDDYSEDSENVSDVDDKHIKDSEIKNSEINYQNRNGENGKNGENVEDNKEPTESTGCVTKEILNTVHTEQNKNQESRSSDDKSEIEPKPIYSDYKPFVANVEACNNYSETTLKLISVVYQNAAASHEKIAKINPEFMTKAVDYGILYCDQSLKFQNGYSDF